MVKPVGTPTVDEVREQVEEIEDAIAEGENSVWLKKELKELKETLAAMQQSLSVNTSGEVMRELKTLRLQVKQLSKRLQNRGQLETPPESPESVPLTSVTEGPMSPPTSGIPTEVIPVVKPELIPRENVGAVPLEVSTKRKRTWV